MHEHDPHGTDTHAPGAKLDAGKLRPWLCISGFPRAMAEVARVTTKGAEKYSDNGWQAVPNGACRYMDAFARHMLALARGDEEEAVAGQLGVGGLEKLWIGATHGEEPAQVGVEVVGAAAVQVDLDQAGK